MAASDLSVNSVAGKKGDVTLSASDITGLSDALVGLIEHKSPKKPNAGDWFVIDDQKLHIHPESPLDYSLLRQTAVPAGSLGRVTVSGDNLVENGVTVRFNVATWAADSGFFYLPTSTAAITAAAEHLARAGYNCLRVHGIENWLLSGSTGEWQINATRLDQFYFFISECKRVGLYWVMNPMNWWLGVDMAGATNRFTLSNSDGGMKTRIYTQQEARNHWLAGINAIYNQVNPYTGINILQDPAMLMLELYNEFEVTYIGNLVGNNGFPALWLNRDNGTTAAAKTWPEWLADSTQLHDYQTIADLNTSWGTAYADFATAGAAAFTPNSFNGNASGTNKQTDVGMYAQYLEQNLTAYFQTAITSMGALCLTTQHTIASGSLMAYGCVSTSAPDSVSNTHGYPMLADKGLDVGSVLSKPNIPVWDSNNRSAFSSLLWGAGGKPNWFGEFGWPSWGKYRAQFPVWVAAMVQNNAAAVSYFCQGRFMEPTMKLLSDATTAQRFGRVYPYCAHGDPSSHFTAALVARLQLSGVMTRQTSKTDYVTNSKAYGFSTVAGALTRNSGRPSRQMGSLSRPMMYASMLGRSQITYDPNIAATDDTYAATNLALNWKQFMTAAIPTKSISAVMTTGTFGGYTASVTQPILTLTDAVNANAVTGDEVYVSNLTGTGGTWPGTTLAQTACPFIYIDSQHIQITSGLNLTGLNGANFTAGTYTEASASLKSMYQNSGNIVAVYTSGTYLGATATNVTPIFVLGANGGSTGTHGLQTGDEFFLANLAGTGGTGAAWPGTGKRASAMTVNVLDFQTVQVTSGAGSAFPDGLVGAAPSSSTWTEGLNIVEGRYREWGMSSRLQRAWINTRKLVAFFHGSATTFPVTIQNVTFTSLTNDASIFLAALDNQPLSSSKKILVGMVGDSQNSGMSFSDGTARRTVSAGGTYPIQVADNHAAFTIARTVHGNPRITPLGLSGVKLTKAKKLAVDATNIFVEIQNAAASNIFWLIEV